MGPEDYPGCASLLSAVLCLVKAPVSLELSSSVNLQQEGYPGVLWASIWEYPLSPCPGIAGGGLEGTGPVHTPMCWRMACAKSGAAGYPALSLVYSQEWILAQSFQLLKQHEIF